MSRSDLVRFSRDGDQFHYRWAARRCLRLLDSRSDLVAITIEGVSASEGGSDEIVAAGEEVVDVAEYYGSQSFKTARRVDYIQLKHSTVRTQRSWTASGLERTLKAFGQRYSELRKTYGSAQTNERLSFSMFSNRPFAKSVVESVADLASGATPRHANVASELVRHAGLARTAVKPFFERLNLRGQEGNFRDQANLLSAETNAYLAGHDLDAALRLRDLVTSKATSEGRDDPSIIAGDVLQALRIGRDDIFPAPSRLEPEPNAIAREQEAEIAAVVASATMPVLISAPGGVGKSVLATRLGMLMPPGSATILYDCFGNGEYRQLAHSRHPHRIALVQIANELAAMGLCDPLLPTPVADAREYMRGFIGRLSEAARMLRTEDPSSVVMLIIDAADNAQMAAEDAGASNAFVRDLLRQSLPEGVRLAMLFRPEREYYLNPPPSVIRIRLAEFSAAESAAHLRGRYPQATDHEALEFHRLSSANPRVQANALAAQPNLQALLQSLGPNPTSVNDQIAEQLHAALALVKDDAGRSAGDIDVLCAALAALRPLVPIEVLAGVSGLAKDAIRSFVSDFGGGRPLLITGDAVQFRDEPVEGWFRETYRADTDQLRTFVDRLKPLANTNAYVAACLPSLMLACDQIGELVDIALSQDRLPADSPLERRQIELERLQFALRASLRARRWTDAAMLATKAGEEAAGAERHNAVLRGNTDIVGRLFEAERLQELAARQVFVSDRWLGCRYAREAALLSAAPELRGDALGKLRMAESWLNAWSRLPHERREDQEITDEDRADMALAHLNLYGADVACRELARWAPDTLWYESGLVLARRLVDLGHFVDLHALAEAAANRNLVPLIGAIAVALNEVNRSLGKVPSMAMLSAKTPRSRRLRRFGSPWLKRPNRRAIVSVVEAAIRHDCASRPILARKLSRVLPKEVPREIASRFRRDSGQYLRAYTLRAALLDKELTLESLAPDDVRQSLEARSQSESHEVREFKSRVGGLLPWWKLRARVMVSAAAGETIDLAGEIAAALKASKPSFGYYELEYVEIQDEIALIWFDLLCEAGPDGKALATDFETWVDGLRKPLFIPTWTALARKAARSANLQERAYTYARRAVSDEWHTPGEHADSRIETFVAAARAIFNLDPTEAGEYLSEAVVVASRLGDEVFSRWHGVLSLAKRAAVPGQNQDRLAYRLSRAAELCAEYVYDHFDWGATISNLTRLSPPSAVAVVSRWRDREVGWFDDHFSELVRSLVEVRQLDAVLGCSFIGFRFDWRIHELLERALSASSNAELRQTIFSFVVRYKSLDYADRESWRRLIALGQQHGLDVSAARHFQRLARASSRRPTPPRRMSRFRRSRPVDLTEALRDWPVETASGAIEARSILRNGRRSYIAEQFWAAVFGRVPDAHTPGFVQDVLDTSTFDLYDVHEFLTALPSYLLQRKAVKGALKAAMERVAMRLCWGIRMHRHSSGLPVAEAACLSGLSERAVVEQVLGGVAEDTEPAGALDLFELVPLLSTLLEPGEARTALDYALSLIEVSLKEGAGDGPWRHELGPQLSTNEALAGLIWGALGSVNEDVRWQAAHVVRSWALFGRQEGIRQLALRAEQGPGAFASPTLTFYQHDALQWFVVALARSAREAPQVVADCTALLNRIAQREYPHVLIRHYAADALLALDQAGVSSLTDDRRAELKALNASRLPRQVTGLGDAARVDRYARKDREHNFAFHHDISKHLMEGLARAFEITLPELERMAEGVIRTDWKLDANGHWDQDPRRSLPSLNRRGRGHGGPASSYNEHLSFHATMTVAGKLLESHPVQQYPEEHDDEFVTWLGYQTLTRPDGLWLFDRRDPTPLLPRRRGDQSEDVWRWSVTASDFDRALGLHETFLVVWGSWTEEATFGHEQVDVSSALVDPCASLAYLAAAQTADHPWDFHPPAESGDNDIDEPPFVLRPWVKNDRLERHLDRHDPWAADMSYPPPVPAHSLVKEMKLASADDGRRWHLPGRRKPLFVSEVWTAKARDQDDYPRPEGDRLRIKRRELPLVLSRTGMDLIVEVEIRRQIPRYERKREAGELVEYPLPYFRYYLFHRDGTVETLS